MEVSPLAEVDVPKQSVHKPAVPKDVAGLPLQGGKLHPSVEDNNRSAKPIRTSSTDRFIP